MTAKTKDPFFLKRLLSLTLPIAFQSLMLSAVAAADALMLGSVEQNAMAAVSLATQIQFIQNMILSAVITALSILGAQYWGKKDSDTLNQIFCITLRVSAIVSIIFFVLCEFTPRFLMLIFTNEEELIQIGIGYLKIAAWSYLLTGISQCYLATMKVSDHQLHAAIVSTVSVIVNIILNAVLIFGLLGLPELSVRGAAIATLVARIIEILWVVIASYFKGYIHPNAKSFFHFDKQLSWDFAKCAFPLVGACLLWGIGFTSYTAFMGHMGKDAAAANSITSVVRDLLCCLCNGLASGGGILVGNSLGAGKLEEGKRYGIKLMKLAFVLGFATTAVMLALTPLVTKFVKLTPMAKYDLVGMMIIMSVYMIGRVVNTIIINGIFAAGGDTMFDMYSLAVVMWGLAVPLAALGTFVFHWPVFVVYACTCLDEVGKIPWVLIHFKKYKWVKDLTR